MKTSTPLSAWSLIPRDHTLFHAKVEYVGRGKFMVKQEYTDQALLGKVVDASEIISWNLVPR